MKEITQNQRQDESFFSKASAYTSMVLKALVNSPQAAEAIRQVEQECIDKRRDLLKARDKLDNAYPDHRLAIARAAEKAAQVLRDAEQALTDARAAYSSLNMQAYGADMQHSMRRGDIDKQLLVSSDHRIGEFIAVADNILTHDLAMALTFWIDQKESRPGHTVQRCNVEDVARAKDAVRQAMAPVAAMRFEALTYVDVSQRLMAACAEMAPALAKLSINPPSLTAEHAEVGANAKWSGQSVWVFDAPPTSAQEERASIRQALTDERAPPSKKTIASKG